MTAIALIVIAACLLVQAVVGIINTVFMFKDSKRLESINLQNAMNAPSPRTTNTCSAAKEKITNSENKNYLNDYRDVLDKISKITDAKVRSFTRDKRSKDPKFAGAVNLFVTQTSPKALFPENPEKEKLEGVFPTFGIYKNEDPSFENPLLLVNLDEPIDQKKIEDGIEEIVKSFIEE